jgi:hypothetical protein
MPLNFRSAVKSVPSELIFTGYTWETTREHYFMRHANWAKASEVRELRKLYAARLWDECGITVDLEEGFA